MALFLRSDIAFTNPLKDTPLLPPQPYTSDTFTGSGALRATNAGRGGQPLPWEGTSGAALLTGGTLAYDPKFQGAWFVGVAEPARDVEVNFRFPTLPPVGIFIDIRRQASSTSSPVPASVRLQVSAASLQFQKRVDGLVTTWGWAAARNGDTIGLRAKGSVFSVLVNGEVMLTETDTDAAVQSAGFSGLAGSATGDRPWAVDDFVLGPV